MESVWDLLTQENRWAYLCMVDPKNETEVHKLVMTSGSDSVVIDKKTGEVIDLDELDEEIEIYLSPIN